MDGALARPEREDVQAHLENCGDCRALLRELRAVRDEARRLPPIEPPEHVWVVISEAVRSRGTTRHRGPFQIGLAIAAAVVLGISLWAALRPIRQEPSDKTALAQQVTDELRAAEAHYDNAIAGLEKIIADNEGAMPTELNDTLMANLDLIEQAIDESRVAITTDPNSPAAQESLLEAFRRKVELLQNTILLINDLRKGESRNALDRIEEIRRNEDPSNPI